MIGRCDGALQTFCIPANSVLWSTPVRRLAHSLSPAPPHTVDLGPGERRSTRPRNGQLSRDRLCCSSGSFANKRFPLHLARFPLRHASHARFAAGRAPCQDCRHVCCPRSALQGCKVRYQCQTVSPHGAEPPVHLHDHRRALGALEILEQGDGALPLLGTSDCLFALASAVKLPFRLISVDLHRGSRRRTSLRETTASALVANSDATSPSST